MSEKYGDKAVQLAREVGFEDISDRSPGPDCFRFFHVFEVDEDVVCEVEVVNNHLDRPLAWFVYVLIRPESHLRWSKEWTEVEDVSLEQAFDVAMTVCNTEFVLVFVPEPCSECSPQAEPEFWTCPGCGMPVELGDVCPDCQQAALDALADRDEALPLEYPRGRAKLFKDCGVS